MLFFASYVTLLTQSAGAQDPSGFTLQVWDDPAVSKIRQFLETRSHHTAPDHEEALAESSYTRTAANQEIHCMAGWVTPRVTGSHTFWVRADGPAMVRISEANSIQQRKMLIRYPSYGTGGEDKTWGQRSHLIQLKAGHHYRIETWFRSKAGERSVQLGWSYVEGTLTNWAAQEGCTALVYRNGVTEPQATTRYDRNGNGGEAGPVLEDPPLTAPGERVVMDLGQPRAVARVSLHQRVRAKDRPGESVLSYEVTLRDEADTIVGTYTYEPDHIPYFSRWEWELDQPVVARSLEIRSVGQASPEGLDFAPVKIQVWGPDQHTRACQVRSTITSQSPQEGDLPRPDQDRDKFADAWEELWTLSPEGPGQHVLDPMADSDNDGMANYLESWRKTSPLEAQQDGGHMRIDYWFDFFYYNLNHARADTRFLGSSSVTAAHWMGRRPTVIPNFSLLRMRGYFIPPETGDYVFWLSARNSGELWLSSDHTKYRKELIAEISVEDGGGHGTNPRNRDHWDQFARQKSLPIRLVKDQPYFLETLTQQGHAGGKGHTDIAWKRLDSEQPRTRVQRSCVRSYVLEEGDGDDDYLPDAWEVEHGLDPADNGFTNRGRDGERGDFDQDGLNNREEYLLGTNPALADSDNDGLSDGDEVKVYGTDPQVSDAPSDELVTTIDVPHYTSSDHSWSLLNGLLVSSRFRGGLEWQFSVPSDGHYLYHLQLQRIGGSLFGEDVLVHLSLDGIIIRSSSLSIAKDVPTLWRVLGPHLTAGTHTLRLEIDNQFLSRTIGIAGVEVRKPLGPDDDGDGVPDWYLAQFRQGSALSPHDHTTHVSPVCLEGTVSQPFAPVLLNGAATRSLGAHHWFADAPLADGVNEIVIDFPGGHRAGTVVEWTPLNVLTAPDQILRPGDTLKLGAFNTTGEAVAATIVAPDGTNLTLAAGNTVDLPFAASGSYSVSAQAGADVHSFLVTVASPPLADEIPVVANKSRVIELPAPAENATVVYQGSEGLLVVEEEGSSTPFALRLFPSVGGHLALTARLGEGGPILDVASVPSILIADSLAQGTTRTFGTGAPAGYFLVRAPLVVLGLPEGATVEVTIFRAGVMFPDGTTTKILTAADFDHGFHNLDFFFPKGTNGGYCHYLTVYDKDGNILAKR